LTSEYMKLQPVFAQSDVLIKCNIIPLSFSPFSSASLIQGPYHRLCYKKLSSLGDYKYTECFIMYPGITKIYDTKNVGHAFTKLVQTEVILCV
jgi:hypothetical protein